MGNLRNPTSWLAAHRDAPGGPKTKYLAEAVTGRACAWQPVKIQRIGICGLKSGTKGSPCHRKEEFHKSPAHPDMGSGRKCWSVGAENLDQFPANRSFRAQAGCQRRRSRTKAGLRPGHPEATLRPTGGQPVGTLKPLSLPTSGTA